MLERTAQTIQTIMTDCMEKLKAVRAEIRQQLESLPDNPDIERRSENSFTMSSSKLEELR